MAERIKLIGALSLTVLFAYIQISGVLRIAQINPNLVLTALVVLAFFINNGLHLALLACIAAAFLVSVPGASAEFIGFLGAAGLAFMLRHYIRWQSFLSCITIVAIATTCFYLLVDAVFLAAHAEIFAGELVYNMALGAGLMFVFKEIEGYLPKSTRRISRR